MIIIALPRGSAYKAPAACSNLVAKSETREVILTWTDPEDAKKAKWAGTKLVRKDGSAPTSWEDGTVVAVETVKNQYATSGYSDKTGVLDTEYYYAVFPYSDHNKYGEGISVTGTAYTKKPLAAYTWAEIAKISDDIASGVQDKSILSLHDTKELRITNNSLEKDTYEVEIIGFNHDDLSNDRGKAGITFAFKEPLRDQNSNLFYMSIVDKPQTYSDYYSSNMHLFALRNILDGFDSDISPYVTSMIKKLRVYTGGVYSPDPTMYDNYTYRTKLTLLSEMEYTGKSDMFTTGDEGLQYEAYANSEDRVQKYPHWFRSGTPYHTNNRYCDTDGETVAANGPENGRYGIIPHFCLTAKPEIDLNNLSWLEIATMASNGEAKEKLHLTDEKEIQLTGKYAQKMIVQIIDFGHDDLVSGGKAGITFEFKYLLNQLYGLSSEVQYEEYNYMQSEMNTVILPELKECFPDDLKPYIQTVYKECMRVVPGSSDENDSDLSVAALFPPDPRSFEIIKYPCDLFLRSYTEVTGDYTVITNGTNKDTEWYEGTINELSKQDKNIDSFGIFMPNYNFTAKQSSGSTELSNSRFTRSVCYRNPNIVGEQAQQQYDAVSVRQYSGSRGYAYAGTKHGIAVAFNVGL